MASAYASPRARDAKEDKRKIEVAARENFMVICNNVRVKKELKRNGEPGERSKEGVLQRKERKKIVTFCGSP